MAGSCVDPPHVTRRLEALRLVAVRVVTSPPWASELRDSVRVAFDRGAHEARRMTGGPIPLGGTANGDTAGNARRSAELRHDPVHFHERPGTRIKIRQPQARTAPVVAGCDQG